MNLYGLDVIYVETVDDFRRVTTLARDGLETGISIPLVDYSTKYLDPDYRYSMGSSCYDLAETAVIGLRDGISRYAGVDPKMRALILCAWALYDPLVWDAHAIYRARCNRTPEPESQLTEIWKKWRKEAAEKDFTATDFQVLNATLFYVHKNQLDAMESAA